MFKDVQKVIWALDANKRDCFKCEGKFSFQNALKERTYRRTCEYKVSFVQRVIRCNSLWYKWTKNTKTWQATNVCVTVAWDESRRNPLPLHATGLQNLQQCINKGSVLFKLGEWGVLCDAIVRTKLEYSKWANRGSGNVSD